MPIFSGATARGLADALAAFRLGELADLPAGMLSAGQKRKLALSRLFARPRPIWLLDEPSGLARRGFGQAARRGARRHLKAGGVAIVASHVTPKTKFARKLALGLERVS